ncbi:SUKH-4 family immunity protein [Streptomyces physcomitrii]|uniref:SUKH-4 family immunity protein n=1 Tax=Streptomyces physcomitrii TaxID=2724184 RepID=UPI000A589BAE
MSTSETAATQAARSTRAASTGAGPAADGTAVGPAVDGTGTGPATDGTGAGPATDGTGAGPATDGTGAGPAADRIGGSAPSESFLPCLTRAFARSRARGWLSASGAGLILDLPERLLAEEFGPGRVMRFEDVDFPAALRHAPTRRFLRDLGLPEDVHPFHLDTELPLPTLTQFHAEPDFEEYASPALPAQADALVRLGRLAHHGTGVRGTGNRGLGPSADPGSERGVHLVVDGGTGALLAWRPDSGALTPLHADVSTLAFALWLRQLESATAVA